MGSNVHDVDVIRRRGEVLVFKSHLFAIFIHFTFFTKEKLISGRFYQPTKIEKTGFNIIMKNNNNKQ